MHLWDRVRLMIPWVPFVGVIVVLFIMGFCREAQGETPLKAEFKLLPPGNGFTLVNKIKVRYYELSDYTKLVEFDKELVKLRADIQDMGDVNQKISLQLKILETRLIPTLENDKKILTKRGLRLEEKWQKCEDALVKAEGGPAWPYIIGVAGVVVGAVAIGMYVECKLRCN